MKEPTDALLITVLDVLLLETFPLLYTVSTLPSWTLFICLELLYAGSLYEIGWEGNGIMFS